MSAAVRMKWHFTGALPLISNKLALYLRLISFRNINSIYLPKYSQKLDRRNLLSYGINTTTQKKKTTGKFLALNAILQG